ncbi:uncharacterized protein N7459_008004 [Penicillium hispanicum]|uniref:uncharacterized protein n=1 Tax=Penicillium hispanicum TaxID=1080232 RepID=UPI00254178B7|nr:uncharacterized protein N7459_008004 [Penicillium hispanicum]KAJ5573577.1 hypothetical protein N7459_008004 [Penicillium hispanicum]
MFKNISGRVSTVLLALLAVQPLCPVLAAETNPTNETIPSQNVTNSTDVVLSPRASVHWKIVNYLRDNSIAIAAANQANQIIGPICSGLFGYFTSSPDSDKKCGASGVNEKTADGTDYRYYVYVYSTGSHCDTTERAKTLTNAVSSSFDEFHELELAAACVDYDHGGTWHGVVGIATKASGKDPEEICQTHIKNISSKKRAVSFNASSGSLEASNSTTENDLVKRTSISVSKSNKKSGSTKFGNSNKCQTVILDIAQEIDAQSESNSCAAVTGRKTGFDGVTYNYYYEASTSGSNCDTTAELKTIVSAIDDAWDDLGSHSAACLTMSHGGTWQGNLGITAMQSDYPAQKMC